MESLTAVKIASTFIIFTITIVFGSLPACVVHFMTGRFVPNKLSQVLSYLNCFAGGVFLGTAMLHLLSESEEDLKSSLAARNLTDIHYPVTEFVITGGFFLVLATEVIVLSIMHTVNPRPGGRVLHHQDEGTPLFQSYNEEHSPRLHIKFKKKTLEERLSASGVHKEVQKLMRTNPPAIRAVLLVFALSLHMVFEGVAVGLQKTEIALWTLMLAISLHKCIVAFSVGLEMRQVLGSLHLSIFLFVFAVISSFGVPLGFAVTQSNVDNSMAVSMLKGMAAGTFLYITFFEILQREFTHCHSIWKLIICIVGYSCVAGLKILDKE